MTSRRVGIAISGSGSNMEKLIQSMTADHPGRPALVVSNRADAGGLPKAQALGVETAVVPSKGRPKPDFEAELQAALAAAGVEVLCLAGFMRVLSPGFVTGWADRILNIHPSLLPLFKGLDTHARALASGMAVHGCSVHVVTADLDDGPILGQAVIPILAGDTPDVLAARLLPMEHMLYPRVLRAFLTGARDKTVLFGQDDA